MNSLVTAAKLFAIFFILTGMIYPLTIMVIATTAFPYQAHGSLIILPNGSVVGSELIGQNFSLPRYFQGRPSATSGAPYNATSSGGSNLGPTNPFLLSEVADRIKTLNVLGMPGPIPSDLVTSSASGLDPHLSLDAALLQVPIIAKERNISEVDVRNLVISYAINPQPFAQPYVHILSLNRALEERSGGIV
ncbi:MAG: potassium-transporting ATPase subunit KdpC [Methanomicrobiales archaeon]|nr:potassium-transporting ATPase subunit KdpC [Methanomicrobiales archaeon]